MNANRVIALGAVLALGFVPVSGASARGEEPNVVERERIRLQGEGSATALRDVRVDGTDKGTRVVLEFDGALASYERIELENPPRLALDLLGVAKAPRSQQVGGEELEGIRFGVHPDRVRVVFDVRGVRLPAFSVDASGDELRIFFERRASKAPAVAEVPAAKPAAAAAAARIPAPEAVAKAAPASQGKARVLDVAFEGEGADQKVEVKLSDRARFEVERPDARTRVLTLRGAELPRKLVRSLDTTAFAGPVRTVSSFQDREEGVVRVVVTLADEAKDDLRQEGHSLSWRFSGPPAEATIVDEDGRVTRAAASAGGSRGRYSGTRVSFEFKDIDIHNLLRVIAEVSKKNIIVADDVKGTITIRLRNVPWDQALDLILRAKGLGKEEEGNIIRIAPLDQLQAEREAMVRAQEAAETAQPLIVRILPVNYALAGEVAPKVRDLLSKRGTLTVDARTNTLIIKDVGDVIARAQALIRSLDTQTPQVLIASRIVETSTNFSRELGIQWGGNFSASQATANATGLAFPNNIGGSGSVPGAVGAGGAVPTQPNWAVSFPAGVGESSGGAIGFNFGSAGGAAQLNLRLSALETKGLLKTVSAPRVTTLDNREAVIGQGVSIPFSQVSAAGVNTVFVEAKLELRVTPHVTSDGSILMKIRASNNQPSENLRGANGQPAITKREAETEVLVKDGDTTVIGGIYTRRTSESVAQIPLLGDIPVLGWFFKSRSNSDERTELLIFISPTIVNREASLVAGG